MKTIIALSTPPMRSAIAIVRMSGSEAFSICERVFLPIGGKLPLRKLVLGTLNLDGVSDSCMCCRFSAPHSYTGEDIVEFHCHGSLAITSALIEKCISLGAAAAEAGEFTRRAFLFGKLDLTRAEGIIDLIDSETKMQARAAFLQAEGAVAKEILESQDAIVDALAALEVAMDYPFDDTDAAQNAQILSRLVVAKERLASLISGYKTGRLIQNGIKVVLCGKPNSGKSSLMNAMLGVDRAIVSEIAGTTRDTLSESYEYKGMRFVIVDTAGLSQNPDRLEAMGIQRAEDALKTADVVIWLAESQDDKKPVVLDNLSAPVIFVGSKSDIKKLNDKHLCLSSKTGENVEALKEKIFCAAMGEQTTFDGVIITSHRQYSALTEAYKNLITGISALQVGETADCVSLDLRHALAQLGEITGDVANDQIIDAIFSRFCVGK